MAAAPMRTGSSTTGFTLGTTLGGHRPAGSWSLRSQLLRAPQVGRAKCAPGRPEVPSEGPSAPGFSRNLGATGAEISEEAVEGLYRALPGGARLGILETGAVLAEFWGEPVAPALARLAQNEAGRTGTLRIGALAPR